MMAQIIIESSLAIALPLQTAGDGVSFLSVFLNADWIKRSVIIILLACSIWSWVIAIDKAIQFHLLKKRAGLFEETFWSGRTLDDLQAGLGNDTKDPMAKVFTAAMKEYRDAQATPSGEGFLAKGERIDRVMTLVVNRELAKAESGLTVLATIGSAAVFIGLLGTVWGIINSFAAITATNSTNLAVILPGITEALYATALGLVAAIPAVIFYNMYSRQLQKYAGRLEGYADELSAILSRKLARGA